MSWYGAFSESVNSKSSKSSSISDIPGDPAKIAEAIAVVGEKQVRDRGGVNAQGYFNDVPAYQQLTANERKSVTLSNGHIDSMGMLAILNRKEAEIKQTINFNLNNA